ncbi:hypothetical protein [Stackebrandtia soli]|uniref:hypothetical protein n=1 Tax=Stackebrandtia soli TaxID=1892856 RepID=UPI0039EB33A9
MRREGREWRTFVSTVRLDGNQYRVIRPEGPIVHASLREGRSEPRLSVDKAATMDLATAWWLAARSPHSLVYLPLRSSAFDCDRDEDGGLKLDLVLLHHSLRFPVSRWKAVRARLSHTEIRKETVYAQALPSLAREDYGARRHSDFRDHLRWAIASDTLFLIGSRRAYELDGDTMRELLEECPADLADYDKTYCCTEIHIGRWNRRDRDRRNSHARLHIDCCAVHWRRTDDDGRAGDATGRPLR